jgi:predicted nucleic acid-binding Zn ribbon protein
MGRLIAGKPHGSRTSPSGNDVSVTDAKRPRRNWIQEERRKTLGDYVVFCLRCGFTQRYFLEHEDELPVACPDCDGELRHRCPACTAPFPSAFQVECEECSAEVRPRRLFGVPIRKPNR